MLSKKRKEKKRQDKTRQDKTRQDKTRQDKTRQDKTRQDKKRQDKTRQEKTAPFGVNLIRSQVLYRAAQDQTKDAYNEIGAESTGKCKRDTSEEIRSMSKASCRRMHAARATCLRLPDDMCNHGLVTACSCT